MTTKTSEPSVRRGPSLRIQRILAMILLVAQGGITVTGSIVRVTGSGLGCDTWPNCHEGSLVPVAGAAPAVHQFIEFGNRLLAIVLALIALALFIVLVRAKRRREILWLSFLSGFGVIVQAVIGGISVILNLQWWAVAIHFLPSMVLVWIAALLYMRIAEPDDAAPVRRFPDYIRTLAAVAAIGLAVVLFTGTMVTGSGPHSGDEGIGMEGRLELDTRVLTYVHSAAMYVYLGLTAAVLFLLYRSKAPKAAITTAWVLIAMIAVQWAIGLIQYYLGVPRWTVPAHIAMSSVVVAFTAFLWAHGRRRPVAGADQAAAPDKVASAV